MRRKNAVTLIELMLVMAIMALTVSGFLLLFVRAMFLDDLSRSKTIAVSHAQYVLEGIKAAPFSALEPSINLGMWDMNKTQLETLGLTVLPNETIDTSVVNGSVINITVQVNWRNRDSSISDLSFDTALTAP